MPKLPFFRAIFPALRLVKPAALQRVIQNRGGQERREALRAPARSEQSTTTCRTVYFENLTKRNLIDRVASDKTIPYNPFTVHVRV